LLAFQKAVGALKQSQLTSREQLLGRRASRPQFQLDPRILDIHHLAAQAQRVITQVQEAASKELEMLREQVLLNKLGLSLYDTGKYRQLTEHKNIHESEGGVWHVVWHSGIDETDDDSGRFALRYVTQLLLMAQDAAPEAITKIKRPIPLTEQPDWKVRRQAGDN